MNLNAVLEWVKSNVLIVVFVVLMIAAPVAMYIVTSGMNDTVRQDVSTRVQKTAELARLTTNIEKPDGTSVPGLVNERLLSRYSQVAEQIFADAKAVQSQALEHNRKTREVALQGVLPEMAQEFQEVLPPKFHQALLDRYHDLLKQVNAGTPPTADALTTDIDLKRRQVIAQDFRKTTTDELTPDEQRRLTEELTNLRMSRYAEAARSVGLYADISALNVPAFDRMNPPTIGELFGWQMQYWVVEDVLKALAQSSKADQSVTSAPAKRIISLIVHDVPGGGEEKPPQQSSGGGMGSVGAGGFGADMGGQMQPDMSGQEFDAAPAGAPADPKAPAPRDYRRSLTGRQSNPLYDVIHVELTLVVDSARFPEVLDALAQYNFMTVTELSLSEADPFDSAESGYFYGTRPVSVVHMNIETIWLREWTKEYMPKSVKTQLGIPVEQQPAADASST